MVLPVQPTVSKGVKQQVNENYNTHTLIKNVYTQYSCLCAYLSLVFHVLKYLVVPCLTHCCMLGRKQHLVSLRLLNMSG